MRISAETICRWIYAAAQFGDTSHCHCAHHRHRRRQGSHAQSRRFFPGRIDMGEWPQLVADRARFGGWEADLVCASRGKAALLGCNERRSRFLVLTKVENKTAAAFTEALVPRLCEIPSGLRKTLTLDNGSEMARFKELERATGMFTSFCRTHSPWQLGANENGNGLLRQYFPRGSSFHKITEGMLRKAAERLNNRPRKWLHDQTPAEVF